MTALTITGGVTQRKWGYPIIIRSTPIEQIKYFDGHLCLLVYTAGVLRYDEDESLAIST
jgi:hypothetical protein